MHSFPFSFLRFSLGISDETPQVLSGQDWIALHQWAVKQSLVGVFFLGVQRLAKEYLEIGKGNLPPRNLAMRWSMEAEHIRGLNKKVNGVSVRLTDLFREQGAKTLILKGSANALFYPDPSLRQTGDVDIWVDGGKARVVELLKKMGLLRGATSSSLHVHLDDSLFGMEVEVHFAATRQYAPSHNRALQNFLDKESVNGTLASEEFYVPSIPYALVMQLSHIKQHLFSSGVGLRQLVDYHQLLLAATDEDLRIVSAQLEPCGLRPIAAAVMWGLQNVLHLDSEKMICRPDARRGKMLLKVALSGGNFGWYAEDYKQPVISRWFKDRVRFFRLLPFDAKESLWREMFYWVKTISLIPRRIKKRRLALGKR